MILLNFKNRNIHNLKIKTMKKAFFFLLASIMGVACSKTGSTPGGGNNGGGNNGGNGVTYSAPTATVAEVPATQSGTDLLVRKVSLAFDSDSKKDSIAKNTLSLLGSANIKRVYLLITNSALKLRDSVELASFAINHSRLNDIKLGSTGTSTPYVLETHVIVELGTTGNIKCNGGYTIYQEEKGVMKGYEPLAGDGNEISFN